MKKANDKSIKSIHEFKKHFFPITYMHELEEQLTTEEKAELSVRRSLKAASPTIEPPKSKRVETIEDIEKTKG